MFIRALQTIEFYDFLDCNAMTGENTKQLRQKNQSLRNEINELNAKYKNCCPFVSFPFLI